MAEKILIYGGSGGIGTATGRLLRERGYALHLAGRNEAALAEVAVELDASVTAGDVTDQAFFDRVAGDIDGPLAGLVYAVGTINLRAFPRLTADDFLRDFRINAMGAALAIQAALPALKESESGASVVLYSTVASKQGFAHHGSIAMAKGAVDGLTYALATELAPDIRVNAVSPSLTRTPLASDILSSEPITKSLARVHALQRLGEPADIAALTAFLISPDSSWITGQIIGVDGGRSTLRTKG